MAKGKKFVDFVMSGVKTPAQMKAEMAVDRAKSPETPRTNRIDMSFKDVTKRTPELQEAAQRVASGEMSAAEYDALVNQVKPVTPYDFVPTPATREEAISALTANKKEKYGAAKDWEAGTPVGLRLDIPAYSDHGVWVNSIHGPDSTAYGNVSAVTDARFGNFDDKALKVAQGAAKSPFAKIEGKWNPIEEEEAVRRASEYLQSPEWRQVGMDPERHGYFYDRKTMEPIVASEEVIQIGPLVLAKNPVYGDKGDFKFAQGGVVNMSKGGVGRKIADKILPKVEAPSVMTRSEISELADYIKNREGGYGLRRVERAADEIPRLGEMYTQDALRSAFSGDNAQGLVIMNPNNFEDYAVPLPLQKDIRDLHKYESQIGDPSTHFDKYSLSTNDYVRHLSGVQNKGGFDDVPYLNVFSDEVGLGLNPKIVGHEGRHRNRALAAENVPSGLVILRPSGDLREGLPRRYRDDYIDALRKEFSLVNNKVLPQTYTESNPNSFDETLIRRPPIKIAEPFANGGAVKMAEGGEPSQAELDRMRLELNNSPVIQATPQSPIQRGIGTLGGYMDRAGQFVSKSLEPLAETHPVKHFLGELLLADTLKSAGTALQDYTKTSRDYTEDNPYKRAPITGSGQTMSLDPRMLDVIGFAQPAASATTKLVSAGAKKAAPFAKDVGEMASELYMKGDIPGMVSPNAYVIKPKGGNWLGGGIDAGIDPLRSTRIAGQTPAERIPLHEALLNDPSLNADQLERVQYQLNVAKGEASVDKWIDTKLKKYVQNELATPEDPIRALAAKGVSHMSDEALEASSRWVPDDLGIKRRAAGFPEENMADIDYREAVAKSIIGEGAEPDAATTDAYRRAGGWETIADTSIYNSPASRWLDRKNEVGFAAVIKDNPFLEKAPPETRFNTVSESSTFATDLGFDHLVDELKNATRIDSDLPEKLRIDPSKLEKMTVPQVVERVSEINKWRAEQQVAANQKLAMNPATQVVKEYPDQGYKWVELTKPKDELPEGYKILPDQSNYRNPDNELFTMFDDQGNAVSTGATEAEALRLYKREEREQSLQDALKYEGDTMGHCVGGYCPDVIEGKSRIYSLRDSKGQPHVTIEVQPAYRDRGFRGNEKPPAEEHYKLQEQYIEGQRAGDIDPNLTFAEWWRSINGIAEPPEAAPVIKQIKGKGNAKPKDTYLPFVQDFVKGGQWSEVRDFKNTGLIKEGGQMMTPAEHADWLANQLTPPPDGMKRGGKVQFAKSLDAMRHELTKAK